MISTAIGQALDDLPPEHREVWRQDILRLYFEGEKARRVEYYPKELDFMSHDISRALWKTLRERAPKGGEAQEAGRATSGKQKNEKISS